MSVHIGEGVYRLTQNGKEVGQVVAVDGTATTPAYEHWYLYYDVTGSFVYETYYAASSNDKPPSGGQFGESRNAEWTFEPVGAVPTTFTPSGHLSALQTLVMPGRVKYIEAKALDCSRVPHDSGGLAEMMQILYGGYDLKAGGVKVGSVNVPVSGLYESWNFSGSYVRPTISGAATTFHIVYMAVTVSPIFSTHYCVECNVPT